VCPDGDPNLGMGRKVGFQQDLSFHWKHHNCTTVDFDFMDFILKASQWKLVFF